MSKELEALNDLGDRLASVDTSKSIEEAHYDVFPIIRQALTPPTADEVCEALSEWYGADVKHDYHQHDDINEVYMHDQFYFRKIKTDIDGKPYTIHKSIVVGDKNGLSFNAYLPPHLITLIGRFYEAQE